MWIMKRQAMRILALVLMSASASVAASGPQVRDEASVGRISLADFKKAFDAKAVVVLDVRDAASYAAGHIPGAILAPLEALGQKAAELRTAKKLIVAYCA
jgi:3-mercaptopyruvate sulfurtransferase SseA